MSKPFTSLRRSAWEILGVPEGSAADVVRAAYLRRALESHPDKGGTKEAFQAVAAAFENLCAAMPARAADASSASKQQKQQQQKPDPADEASAQQRADSSAKQRKVPRQQQQQKQHQPSLTPEAKHAPEVMQSSDGKTMESIIPPHVPTYMDRHDVPDYPHAGMVYPCLARNDTDSVRPDLIERQSCAVVGSSAHIMGTGSGKEIDTYANVFRGGMCTDTEVTKFRTDVGRHTSFCVGFSFPKDLAMPARFVLVPKVWRFMDPTSVPRNWNTCHKQWLVMHPEMITAVDEVLMVWGQQQPKPSKSPSHWKNASTISNPSCTAWNSWQTGPFLGRIPGCDSIVDLSAEFYAVLFATTLCQRVVLYGFDLDTNGDALFQTLSTFDKRTMRSKVKDQKEALPLERHLLKLWQKRGLIEIKELPKNKRAVSEAYNLNVSGVDGPTAAVSHVGLAGLGSSEATSAAALPGYHLLGHGLCVTAEETAGAKPKPFPTRFQPAPRGELDAELACNRTPSCTGFTWRPSGSGKSFQLASPRAIVTAVHSVSGIDMLCYVRQGTLQQNPPSDLAKHALQATIAPPAEAAVTATGYKLVGQGRCGKKALDSLAAKLTPKWVLYRDKAAAEKACDNTPGCEGYQLRVSDMAFLLLKEKFDSSCCTVRSHVEECYMKS
mmetsp:Transcript_46181/g.109837  ORF Transcript_46181/g.109837 Transcript_46181/m.109837 type:complete len:665 (+) Transcript_46181:38-2032(+)